MSMNEQDFGAGGAGSKRSKRRLLWLTGGIAGALVLVLGGGIVAYAQFDVLKSPKLIYLQSELHNMDQTQQSLLDGLSHYKKEVDPWLDRPVHMTAELSDFTVGLTGESGSDDKVKKILDIVQKSKLSLDWQSDAAAKQQYGKLNLNLGGEAPIELEGGLDKDKIIARVPLVSDKYMFLNMNDSEELKKLLHNDHVPKKLLTYQDVLNAVSISQEELRTTLEPYARMYADSIRDDQVEVKDGVMQEGDISVAGRAVTVTFSPADLQKLDAALVDKLAADQTMQDMVYSRLTKLIQLLNDSGYPVDPVSKEKFAEAWKTRMDEAKKEMAGDSAEVGGKMTIYINRKHEILAREWKMTGKEQEELTFKTASWNDKDKLASRLFLLSFSDKDGKGAVKLVDASAPGDAGRKGTLSVTVHNAGDTGKPEDVAFSVDYDSKTSAAKDSGVYKIKLSATGSEPVSLESTINTETSKSDTLQDTLISVLLSLKTPQAEADLKDVGFKLHLKQEVKTAVELPALSASNSIDLAKMSDDESGQLSMSAMMGAYKFMTDHNKLFQDLGLSSEPEADVPAMGHADDYSLDAIDSGLGTDADSGADADLQETLRQLTPEQQQALMDAMQQMQDEYAEQGED